VLYGDDTVESAAFWGLHPDESVTQIVQRVCDTLYEYDRIVVQKDGETLPSADGRLVLACFEGERLFWPFIPGGSDRWIPLYGASREHYWVNAHTFLRIEADSLRPACYAFDIDAEWPDERMRAFPMLDLHQVDPEIRIDMKYASEDNFVHTDLYGDLSTVYLPRRQPVVWWPRTSRCARITPLKVSCIRHLPTQKCAATDVGHGAGHGVRSHSVRSFSLVFEPLYRYGARSDAV
jgi:hypothetical protein